MVDDNTLDYDRETAILKALGHPVRFKIIKNLIQNECSVNSIVERLNIPQSTVSQHLGILRNQGIITPKKEGVVTCYRVVDSRVIEIINILKR